VKTTESVFLRCDVVPQRPGGEGDWRDVGTCSVGRGEKERGYVRVKDQSGVGRGERIKRLYQIETWRSGGGTETGVSTREHGYERLTATATSGRTATLVNSRWSERNVKTGA
jgi:hypothetical protein